MTIWHTKHAAGTIATPRPQTAGAVHAAKFTFSAAKAINHTTDLLELGVLPAFARIVDYILVPEGNWAGATVSVGMMSGELGSDDPARTAGAELFAASTAMTAVVRGALASAFNITSTDAARGIGVTFSADIAADATKKITLILFYTQ